MPPSNCTLSSLGVLTSCSCAGMQTLTRPTFLLKVKLALVPKEQLDNEEYSYCPVPLSLYILEHRQMKEEWKGLGGLVLFLLWF